jgi:UDP-N-acetyl-D-mannosaminuronic acid dehydrogenase
VKLAFETACVIGLGYIGLPTAAIIASRGVNVIGVDINQRAVELIKKGEIHIVEPDLDTLVNGAVATGKLKATNEPGPADVFIVAVPTPFTDGNKPDLKYVRDAAEAIAPVLKKGDLVIIESTSPVGTTEQVSEWLAELRDDLTFPHKAGEEADVCLAYSPERVLPGRILIELVRNDRVVGGMTPRCAERAAELYRMIIEGECFVTSARTAELVKLSENAFRDVNIAFANELSLICDRLDLDVWEVAELANRHPRVEILKPGPGVGGHCIAVDPWFIVDSAPEEATLIRTARNVNDGKPGRIVANVLEACERFAEPRVACLGLSYKADIDDLRESPAVEIVRLIAEGATDVAAVEPHVSELPKALAGSGVELVDLDNALDGADIVVLLTDHKEFKAMDRQRLAGKIVFDTRGIWR